MFSKELESLIQATLEDGILEDNEKAALVKRAQNEGVDLDELEIYINSILQKRKRELNEKKDAEYAQIEKEKKAAIGKVCPKCGRQVAPLTLVCECGYEFTESKTRSSVNTLFDKIEEINSSNEKDSVKNKKIIDLIQSFPVPNTKEDIIEFLALSSPNSQRKGGYLGTINGRIICIIAALLIILILTLVIGGEDGASYFALFLLIALFYYGMMKFLSLQEDTNINMPSISLEDDMVRYNLRADAWRAKYTQVMMKARSLRGDVEFSKMLDYYEKQINKN